MKHVLIKRVLWSVLFSLVMYYLMTWVVRDIYKSQLPVSIYIIACGGVLYYAMLVYVDRLMGK